jgi:hypothetical protein
MGIIENLGHMFTDIGGVANFKQQQFKLIFSSFFTSIYSGHIQPTGSHGELVVNAG